MKISKNWLGDFLDLGDLSADDYSNLITTKVAEVDSVHRSATALGRAVVGYVTAVESHPSREKLKIARVNTGKDEVVVVCGATNCRAGMLTAYVTVGTKVNSANGPIEVGEREVGGVLSKGMLASEFELDISSDHSGIVELAERATIRPGVRLSEIWGETDIVLEIDNKSLTHRPDLWSHFGFARELSAILKRPLKINPDRWADDKSSGAALLRELGSGRPRFVTKIETGSKCRRFIGLELVNVTPAQSPLWMRRRLYTVGAGVRNLLVDLSNYVMLDVGHPNHAYDADLLRTTDLSSRPARSGEKLTTLDGVDRELSEHDEVISDGDRAVALAGVIGGQDTAIHDGTRRVFLECACFDPVAVRHTAKRHQVRTDASNRFEKNQSPFSPTLGIQRYVELLQKIDTKVRIEGGVADAFPSRPEPVRIPVSYAAVRQRLGATISSEQIRAILTGLGFVFDGESPSADLVNVTVPYYRATRDVTIQEDLIEEVGRIYGYELIPEQIPLIPAAVTARDTLKEFEYGLRDMLRGEGFSETYSYSFVDRIRAEKLGYSNEFTVQLVNPVDANEDTLRTSLVPNLLAVVERNARLQNQFGLFEFGRSYYSTPSSVHEGLRLKLQHKNAPAFERRVLALAYCSGLTESEQGEVARPKAIPGSDLYALAGLIRRIVATATEDPVVLSAELQSGTNDSADEFFELKRAWMHPFRSASIFVGSHCVGVLGEVKPETIDSAGNRVVVAELDLELLHELTLNPRPFRGVSRFPDSFFEMSVVLPEETPYAELEQLLRSTPDCELLKRVEVLAVYRGAPLQPEEKSISVKLFLGRRDATLSREDLSAIQERYMTAIRASRFTLRG